MDLYLGSKNYPVPCPLVGLGFARGRRSQHIRIHVLHTVCHCSWPWHLLVLQTCSPWVIKITRPLPACRVRVRQGGARPMYVHINLCLWTHRGFQFDFSLGSSSYPVPCPLVRSRSAWGGPHNIHTHYICTRRVSLHSVATLPQTQL
jgi:hypothetical protein